MTRGDSVAVREYDGGRAVVFQQVGDFVILDTEHHAFAFDAGIFRQAISRTLGISVILEAEGSARI